MKKNMTITVKASSLKDERAQSPVAAAMFNRYSRTTTTMAHRNAPRGGARNKQAAYRNGDY